MRSGQAAPSCFMFHVFMFSEPNHGALNMRWTWILLPVIAASLLLGCEDNKKTPTQKQVAAAQWNRARANVMVGLARDQYATGNFDSCRKTVDEALRMDPDNAPLRVISAKLAIESGQLELADKELEKARKIN